MSGTGHAPRCDATAAPGASADPAADPRYARQLAVPGVGPDGQSRLAAARVLCVGAGGLGSPAATYLAAAGVGTIGIVDDDVVELSNLHRQPLHATPDLGRSKADSASERLRALNPHTAVIAHPVRLEAGNALELMADYDLVIDGADTFATRYIVSDATTLLGIPHVWAAVLGSGGQLSVFDARRGPVYRDLFPTIPAAGSVPSCAQAGVLGTVPGILGTALAAEALKLILGWGEPLVGRVAVYDMRDGRWDELPLAANPQVRRPQSPAEVGAGLAPSVTAARLREVLTAAGQGMVVVDVREPAEAAAGAIPGSVNVPLARVLADPGEVLDLAAPGESASWEPAAGPGGPATGEPKASAGVNGALYVHCASGARSAMAVEALLAAARARSRAPRVFDVTGGFEAWARTEPA